MKSPLNKSNYQTIFQVTFFLALDRLSSIILYSLQISSSSESSQWAKKQLHIPFHT